MISHSLVFNARFVIFMAACVFMAPKLETDSYHAIEDCGRFESILSQFFCHKSYQCSHWGKKEVLFLTSSCRSVLVLLLTITPIIFPIRILLLLFFLYSGFNLYTIIPNNLSDKYRNRWKAICICISKLLRVYIISNVRNHFLFEH